MAIYSATEFPGAFEYSEPVRYQASPEAEDATRMPEWVDGRYIKLPASSRASGWGRVTTCKPGLARTSSSSAADTQNSPSSNVLRMRMTRASRPTALQVSSAAAI